MAGVKRKEEDEAEDGDDEDWVTVHYTVSLVRGGVSRIIPPQKCFVGRMGRWRTYSSMTGSEWRHSTRAHTSH